jgi:hypothetical protein
MFHLKSLLGSTFIGGSYSYNFLVLCITNIEIMRDIGILFSIFISSEYFQLSASSVLISLCVIIKQVLFAIVVVQR